MQNNETIMEFVGRHQKVAKDLTDSIKVQQDAAETINELINGMYEIPMNLIMHFMEKCMEMAKENWCPAQVEMLERLFGATIHMVDYDKWEKE